MQKLSGCKTGVSGEDILIISADHFSQDCGGEGWTDDDSTTDWYKSCPSDHGDTTE